MKPTEAASKFNIVIFKETSSFILSVTVKDALTVTLKKPIYNKKNTKHQQYTNLRVCERLSNENVFEEAFSVLFQSLKCAFETTGQYILKVSHGVVQINLVSSIQIGANELVT